MINGRVALRLHTQVRMFCPGIFLKIEDVKGDSSSMQGHLIFRYICYAG